MKKTLLQRVLYFYSQNRSKVPLTKVTENIIWIGFTETLSLARDQEDVTRT